MRTILLFGTAMAILVGLTALDVMAQGNPGTTNTQPRQGGRQRQGNFDPAQFQQRMMDRYRERLEITDDAEWKAIQPLIQNVLDARLSLGTGGRGGFTRTRRAAPEGNTASPSAVQTRTPERSNPAAAELQKAVDSKVPTPEMKTALSKYMEYRKAKQADLDKAREALRAVLTSRQEAIAVLSGLL
jgi:hypothetical protein